MGGAWLAPNLDTMLSNPETKAVLMKTVRMLETHEEIIGLSGHLRRCHANTGKNRLPRAGHLPGSRFFQKKAFGLTGIRFGGIVAHRRCLPERTGKEIISMVICEVIIS